MTTRKIEPVVGQLVMPNGQVINQTAPAVRVRDLARRALAIQSTVIESGPPGIARWMRWQMTQDTMTDLAENTVVVAGLVAFSFTPQRGPELFGLPIILVEQLDGEASAWGCYLAVAA
jgi:hypothetical protein